MSNTPDIRIKIGAYTGVSNAPIYNDIKQIAANINKTPPKIVLATDKAATARIFTSEINEILKNLKLKDISVKASVAIKDAALSKLTDQYTTLQQEIRAASSESDSFSTKFAQQISSLLVNFSANDAMATLQEQLQNTIVCAMELDQCITDLQKATGSSREETGKLLRTYSELGTELGATTAQVAQNADVWLRQGYSLSDTNALIKNSMMLSKLGQMDAADAANALTRVMEGYNVTVADSAHVVDKFIAADMAAGMGSGYISTAMSQAAESARMAGVDINRLTGYLAAMGKATSDGPESVGDFANSLFTRMGSIQGGNLVDPETKEDISDVETVLNNLGIHLRRSDLEFRDFGQVLDDVAGKWSSYGTKNQEAIAAAFSGTDQSEKFIALMENYDEAMEYAEISTNSAGAALDRYNNSYLKSTASSQEAMIAQFERLSMAMWNSDLMKGTIDAGSGILGFLTTLVDALGPLPLLFALATAAKSNFFKKGLFAVKDNKDTFSGKSLSFGLSNVVPPSGDGAALKNISKDISNGTGVIHAMQKEWNNLSAAGRAAAKEVSLASARTGDAAATASQKFMQLSKSFNMANIASKTAALGLQALSMAGNMLMSMAVGFAVQQLIGFLDVMIVTEKEAIQQAAEKAQAYKDLVSEVQSLEDAIKTTSERIDELNGKGNLTLVEQAELARLKESNVQLQRQANIKKDLEKQALKDAQASASDVLHSKTELSSTSEGLTLRDGAQKVSKLTKANETVSIIGNIDSQIEKQRELLTDADADEAKSINASIERLTERKEKAKETLAELVTVFMPLEEQLKGTADGKAVEKIMIAYDKLTHADFTEAFDSVFDESKYDDVRAEIEDLKEAGDVDSYVLMDRFPGLFEELEEIGIAAEDAAQHILAMESAVDSTAAKPRSLENVISDISSLSDGFGALDQIYGDISDKGSFDFSKLADDSFANTFSDLGTAYTDFLSIVSASPTDINKCQGAFDNLITSWLESKGVLKNLSDETKNVTIAMLENVGVTNAEDVVTNQLKRQKIEARLATIDYTGSIYDQINAMSIELETYGFTHSTLSKVSEAYKTAQEAMSRITSSETGSRLKILKEELEAMKTSADVYNWYIKKEISNGENKSSVWALVNAAQNGEKVGGDLADVQMIANALDIINKSIDEVANYKVNFSGASAPKKSSSSYANSMKDTRLEAFNKELAALKHQQAMDEISTEQYYTRLGALRNKYLTQNGTVIEKYLAEYRQYTEELKNGQEELFDKSLEISLGWIERREKKNDWNPGDESLGIPSDDPITAFYRLVEKTEKAYNAGIIALEKYTDTTSMLFDKIAEAEQKESEEAAEKKKELLEDQKDSLQSILDMTVELIKQEKEDEIEALEEKKKAFSDIIDAQKESLKLSERQRSIDEETSERVDEISKLQAQADQLSLDDSAEAKAKRAQLLDEIAEKQGDLDQFQHENAVESAEEALDKQLELFTDEKDREIEKIKDYLSQSGMLVQAAMDRIEREGEVLYQSLVTWNLTYGDGIETTVTDAWNTAKIALDEYGYSLETIKRLTDEINSSDSAPNKNPSENYRSEKEIIDDMKKYGSKWGAASEAEKKRLHENNQKLANELRNLNIYPELNYDNNTGRWYKDKAKKKPLYHNGLKGGFVGGESTPKQNEIYALLTKDELVMNKFDQYRLGGMLKAANMAHTLLKPFSGLSSSSLSNISSANSEIKIEISAPVSITGNVDKNALALLKKNNQNLAAALVTEFSKKGYRPNINLAAIKS